MENAETLTVPASAVQSIGQMERVFVVHDDKAQLRLVRTGATSDGHIEILSGLLENETIITKGNQTILDGQPVTIQPR
jgi:multidrug efflux pump subunit AcrA (membrane-fusion protein)